MMYPMQHLLAILLAGARITAIATDAVAADGPVEKVQSRGLLDPPQSRTGPLNDQKYNNSLNSPNPLQRPPPPLPLLPAEHGGSAIIILANPATKAQPQPRVRLSSSNGSSSTSSSSSSSSSSTVNSNLLSSPSASLVPTVVSMPMQAASDVTKKADQLAASVAAQQATEAARAKQAAIAEASAKKFAAEAKAKAAVEEVAKSLPYDSVITEEKPTVAPEHHQVLASPNASAGSSSEEVAGRTSAQPKESSSAPTKSLPQAATVTAPAPAVAGVAAPARVETTAAPSSADLPQQIVPGKPVAQATQSPGSATGNAAAATAVATRPGPAAKAAAPTASSPESPGPSDAATDAAFTPKTQATEEAKEQGYHPTPASETILKNDQSKHSLPTNQQVAGLPYGGLASGEVADAGAIGNVSKSSTKNDVLENADSKAKNPLASPKVVPDPLTSQQAAAASPSATTVAPRIAIVASPIVHSTEAPATLGIKGLIIERQSFPPAKVSDSIQQPNPASGPSIPLVSGDIASGKTVGIAGVPSSIEGGGTPTVPTIRQESEHAIDTKGSEGNSAKVVAAVGASVSRNSVKAEVGVTSEGTLRGAASSRVGAGAGAVIASNPSGVTRVTADDWFAETFPKANRLLSGFSFVALIKAICMSSNILVQVSPFPTVRNWELRGSTGDADSAPYVAIAFGGFQWCFYGMFAWLLTKRSGFLILVHSNCLGAILGAYYCVAFGRNCLRTDMVHSLNRYSTAVGALAVFQLVTILLLPLERALFLVGLISSFCSFVGATSMLVTVPMVLRTRNSHSIPGMFASACFVSSVAWVTCGVILSDPLVTGPNIASVLCSIICLCRTKIFLHLLAPGLPVVCIAA